MKLPRFVDSWQGLGSSSFKPTKLVTHHEQYTVGETTGGLSVLFTVLCIVDLFGVFPVVALPKSIISCGIYGVPLVLVVFGLQMYTAVLLGRSWLVAQQIAPQIGEKDRRSPYAAVAELAFGPRARRLVTFLIDATVFGAGVPNLLVASQSLQLFWWKITGGGVGVSYCVWMLLLGLLLCPVMWLGSPKDMKAGCLFWWKITGGGVGVSYCVWMLLLGLLLCPVMWLGSPKDMKPLAFSSVFIVSTVAISTWTCIALDAQSPRSRGGVLAHQPGTQDFLIAYGIIAFQFDIHPMLLTIQVDMKDSTKINRAVFLGFFFTGTMFAVTTVLAAYRYGLDVDYNILQGIPASIPLYVVSLLVTLQLCLSSAVGNSALFQHVEDLLKIPRHFCVQRCMLRSGIVALAVFLGEAVPRFDVVMGLVGSTLTGPLMFIFPPLFFLKLSYMKNYLAENDPDFPFKPKLMLSNETDVYQNGDNELSLSKVLRTVNGAFKSYKTFEDLDVDFRTERIKWYEVALSGTVMIMGISATVVATYVSWSDAIRYATFTPPCLVNVTAAARSFLEVTKS